MILSEHFLCWNVPELGASTSEGTDGPSQPELETRPRLRSELLLKPECHLLW